MKMSMIAKPRVPEGLRDLMKDLTREILKEKPTNIYNFAENYFQSRLPRKERYEVNNYEESSGKYDFSYIKQSQAYQTSVALVYSIIPENITNLIKDLIKAVLREQPQNLCDFAVEYLRHVKAATDMESKLKSTEINSTAYECYVSNKERFFCTPYIKCTCGRTIVEAYANCLKNGHLNDIQLMQSNESDRLSTDGTINNVKIISGNDAMYSRKYLNSIFIIQRNFRRFLRRKNATTKTNKFTPNHDEMNTGTATSKLSDVTCLPLPEMPQLQISQIETETNSEHASYTSAFTAPLSATESGRATSEPTTCECTLGKNVTEDIAIENDARNNYVFLNQAGNGAGQEQVTDAKAKESTTKNDLESKQNGETEIAPVGTKKLASIDCITEAAGHGSTFAKKHIENTNMQAAGNVFKPALSVKSLDFHKFDKETDCENSGVSPFRVKLLSEQDIDNANEIIEKISSLDTDNEPNKAAIQIADTNVNHIFHFRDSRDIVHNDNEHNIQLNLEMHYEQINMEEINEDTVAANNTSVLLGAIRDSLTDLHKDTCNADQISELDKDCYKYENVLYFQAAAELNTTNFREQKESTYSNKATNDGAKVLAELNKAVIDDTNDSSEAALYLKPKASNQKSQSRTFKDELIDSEQNKEPVSKNGEQNTDILPQSMQDAYKINIDREQFEIVEPELGKDLKSLERPEDIHAEHEDPFINIKTHIVESEIDNSQCRDKTSANLRILPETTSIESGDVAKRTTKDDRDNMLHETLGEPNQANQIDTHDKKSNNHHLQTEPEEITYITTKESCKEEIKNNIDKTFSNELSDVYDKGTEPKPTTEKKSNVCDCIVSINRNIDLNAKATVIQSDLNEKHNITGTSTNKLTFEQDDASSIRSAIKANNSICNEVGPSDIKNEKSQESPSIAEPMTDQIADNTLEMTSSRRMANKTKEQDEMVENNNKIDINQFIKENELKLNEAQQSNENSQTKQSNENSQTSMVENDRNMLLQNPIYNTKSSANISDDTPSDCEIKIKQTAEIEELQKDINTNAEYIANNLQSESLQTVALNEVYENADITLIKENTKVLEQVIEKSLEKEEIESKNKQNINLTDSQSEVLESNTCSDELSSTNTQNDERSNEVNKGQHTIKDTCSLNDKFYMLKETSANSEIVNANNMESKFEMHHTHIQNTYSNNKTTRSADNSSNLFEEPSNLDLEEFDGNDQIKDMSKHVTSSERVDSGQSTNLQQSDSNKIDIENSIGGINQCPLVKKPKDVVEPEIQQPEENKIDKDDQFLQRTENSSKLLEEDSEVKLREYNNSTNVIMDKFIDLKKEKEKNNNKDCQDTIDETSIFNSTKSRDKEKIKTNLSSLDIDKPEIDNTTNESVQKDSATADSLGDGLETNTTPEIITKSHELETKMEESTIKSDIKFDEDARNINTFARSEAQLISNNLNDSVNGKINVEEAGNLQQNTEINAQYMHSNKADMKKSITRQDKITEESISDERTENDIEDFSKNKDRNNKIPECESLPEETSNTTQRTSIETGFLPTDKMGNKGLQLGKSLKESQTENLNGNSERDVKETWIRNLKEFGTIPITEEKHDENTLTSANNKSNQPLETQLGTRNINVPDNATNSLEIETNTIRKDDEQKMAVDCNSLTKEIVTNATDGNEYNKSCLDFKVANETEAFPADFDIAATIKDSKGSMRTISTSISNENDQEINNNETTIEKNKIEARELEDVENSNGFRIGAHKPIQQQIEYLEMHSRPFFELEVSGENSTTDKPKGSSKVFKKHNQAIQVISELNKRTKENEEETPEANAKNTDLLSSNVRSSFSSSQKSETMNNNFSGISTYADISTNQNKNDGSGIKQNNKESTTEIEESNPVLKIERDANEETEMSSFTTKDVNAATPAQNKGITLDNCKKALVFDTDTSLTPNEVYENISVCVKTEQISHHADQKAKARTTSKDKVLTLDGQSNEIENISNNYFDFEKISPEDVKNQSHTEDIAASSSPNIPAFNKNNTITSSSQPLIDNSGNLCSTTATDNNDVSTTLPVETENFANIPDSKYHNQTKEELSSLGEIKNIDLRFNTSINRESTSKEDNSNGEHNEGSDSSRIKEIFESVAHTNLSRGKDELNIKDEANSQNNEKSSKLTTAIYTEKSFTQGNTSQPNATAKEENTKDQENTHNIGIQTRETYIGNQNLAIYRIRNFNEGLIGSISGQRFAETHLRSFWREYLMNNSAPLSQYSYMESEPNQLEKHERNSKHTNSKYITLPDHAHTNEEQLIDNVKESLSQSKLSLFKNQNTSCANNESNLPNAFERMPTYFYGIPDLALNDTANQAKHKLYKKPTSLIIPISEFKNDHVSKSSSSKEVPIKYNNMNDSLKLKLTGSAYADPLLASQTRRKLFQDLNELKDGTHDFEWGFTNSVLHTITGLNESETLKPADHLESLDNDFASNLKKLSNSTSTSWKTGSKEDNSFVSDEFLEAHRNVEYTNEMPAKSAIKHKQQGCVNEFPKDYVLGKEIQSQNDQSELNAQVTAAKKIQTYFRQYMQKKVNHETSDKSKGNTDKTFDNDETGHIQIF